MGWAYVSWWMALLPLGALVALQWRRRFPALWWVVASALAVSWVADAAALALPLPWRWVPSLLYPIVQALILSRWLLKPGDFWRFAAVLGAVFAVSIIGRGVWEGEDLVRTVAWIGGGVIWWEAKLPSALWWTLAITFGAGWLTWVWHLTDGTVATWYPYQAVRLLGILVFLGGAWQFAAAPTGDA